MNRPHMKNVKSHLGFAVDKEIKLLHQIETEMLPIEQLSTAQQIMASIAFNKPEFLPSHWSDKSEEQLYKRLSDEQRSALQLYSNPSQKNVNLFNIFGKELLNFTLLLTISFMSYFTVMYFSAYFSTPNTVDAVDPLVQHENDTRELASWIVSFAILTGAWLYNVMDSKLRVVDICYHFIISMALLYFGIRSSGHLLIPAVLAVEFMVVKIIYDRNRSNKEFQIE